MSASQNTDFDFGTRTGILLITEFFAISALAVLGLLTYILYSSVRMRSGAQRRWSTSTHVHWYFISLLVADGVQAVGGIMSIRWIVEARVTVGTFCTAQGALKQIGDVGVALSTLAVTVHTFCILVFKWQPDPSPRLAVIVLGFIWTFLFVIVTANLVVHPDFYGNTHYWCWITDVYPVQRIALEYFWMWFTSLGNIVLYIILALVVKGYVIFEGCSIRIPARDDRVHLELRTNQGSKNSHGLAMQMLFYPAVYTITVLPIAIARWSTFTGEHVVPFWATVLADIIFASSGLFNVILFTVTRPMLVPQRNRQPGAFTITSPMRSATQPDMHMSVRRGHAYSYDGEDSSVMEEPWVVATRSVTPDKYKPSSSISLGAHANGPNLGVAQ